MIGLILAAGAGRRLRPLTDDLPKALLPVRGEETILDLAVANLARVGIEEVTIVAGYAEGRILDRVPWLRREYGLAIDVVSNPKAEEWNNAYSLWCARDAFAGGALLVNGDTVHPASIEECLLGAPATGIAVAVDDDRGRLTEEAMKVATSNGGSVVTSLHKGIPVGEAHGEYIGVAVIHADAAARLAQSLEATWRRDPNLYYEDGFVDFIRAGGAITAVPIGPVDWIEVDDHADLARARELACRY
jgi:choline kinase